MKTNRWSSGWRLADTALIGGFLVLLVLPCLGLVRHRSETVSLTENRTLAPSPPLSLLTKDPKAFLGQFAKYFDDHFLLRRRLVELNSSVRYFGFGESPSSRVIVGAFPWLFFAGEETVPCDLGNEMAHYRALHSFSDQQLQKLRRLFEARARWARGVGARFLFVIPPNKSAIYRKFMPESINRLSDRSQVDQVVEMLRSSTTIEVLDLRSVLDSAKESEQVYSFLDTHWNSQGAYAAYSEILSVLARWFPELVPIPRSELRTFVESTRGDLAALMGLGAVLTEPTVQLVPPQERFRFIAAPVPDGGDPERARRLMQATEVADSRLPTALIFGDSFMTALQPYLSHHFRTAVYVVGHRVDGNVVAGFKPQLVLVECIARKLEDLLEVEDNLPEPGARLEIAR